MNHLSLFSGIGGIDLAAEWAGFKTVCFVEIDPFCQKILKKHWPDTPIIGDIRDVTKERLAEVRVDNSGICRESAEETLADTRQLFSISQSADGERGDGQEPTCLEVGQSNSHGRRGADRDIPITLITGGFPCQPVSVAGKRKGKDDDRWLWPEMLRVIREVRPTWAVCENVAGLIHMGLDDCLSDLENSGYEVQTFLIPACAVNAPHRRDRIFIVAHTNYDSKPISSVNGRKGRRQLGQDVADADTERPQRHRGLRECGGQWLTWTGSEPLDSIWKSEPPIHRVASGVSKRVDRLRALGNAVVPQQIYPVLKAIALTTNAPLICYNQE